MSRLRSAVAAALLGLLLLGPAPRAAAQVPVTDSAHIPANVYHQILHYIARALEIYQKYQMIYNQYQQLAYQVQSLAKLENPRFRDIARLLIEIDQILGDAESLAYSLGNINALFKETFPGWEEPKDWNASSFAQVRRTLSTLRVSLETVNSQYRHVEEHKQKLDAMKAQVTSVSGHEQALWQRLPAPREASKRPGRIYYVAVDQALQLPDGEDPAMAAYLRFKSWCEFANVYRALNELDEAEEALCEARDHLDQTSGYAGFEARWHDVAR